MLHEFNEYGLCTSPEAVSYEGNDCEVKFFVAEQNAGWSWGYYLKTASNYIYVWPRKMAVVATRAEAWQNADRDATEFVGKLEGWGRPWIGQLREGLTDLREQLNLIASWSEKASQLFQVNPDPVPTPETVRPSAEAKKTKLVPGKQLSIF